MKTINGKPHIEAQVHRAPTEYSSTFGYIAEVNSFHIFTNGEDPYNTLDNLAISQHLYITIDGEPRDGDYLIEDFGGGVFGPYQKGDIVKNPKKIIATTDPKLLKPQIKQVNWMGSERLVNLAKIPQSFIEEYCKAGGIDKVLVEVDFFNDPNSSYIPKYLGDFSEGTIWKPKLNPDNTIIIHPVEEKTLTLKQAILLAEYVRVSSQSMPETRTIEFVNEWIEENL